MFGMLTKERHQKIGDLRIRNNDDRYGKKKEKKTLVTAAPTNATTATALNARSIAAVIPTNIVTSATTVAATATLTTVAAAPAAVTAKSTTIAYVSDTEAATSTTAVDVKTTAAVNIFAIFATGNTITIPHADTSHSKITIIDVLTTAAVTYTTKNTAAAVFTTVAATLTTAAATLVTTTIAASVPKCCGPDVVPLDCCDIPTTAAVEPITATAVLTTSASNSITATASNIAAIIPITTVAIPATVTATSTTAAGLKTTAIAILTAATATRSTISTPHADASHSKITIVDILTTAAATFATRSTGSAIFTTAVATLTTTAATLATTTAVASTPDCCKLDVVSTLGCCDGPTTAAAESTTSASTLDCCGLDVVLILDCCTVRTTAATISTTAASTVDCCKMDVVPVLDCCNVPYTAAVEPATETAISATTTAKLDCCGDAALMLDCCDVSNIPTLPTTVMRPMIPLATTGSVMNSQFRHQFVSKNLNQRFIPQVYKMRTKRQIEICSGCNNVLPISGMQLKNGERNGYLAVVYGANPFGCRTADLICDSGFLVNQTAIVYANGVKNIPLAMSLTGKAQVTLTCDENVRWKAPNSIINIWNVTCIFRENNYVIVVDQPIPTTPVPTTVPPKPCSTCMNLITARVKNPALNEGEGKLAIEYTLNEFGCRVAKIICSSSDENVETIIYFNGMKNMPVISSKVGAATILLSCHENRRFRVDSSRANVENVTCLTRGPPLCAICENIKGILRKNLQVNEMNAPLRIEYSKQTDGCRAAFIVCGYEKPGAVARIYFNEETMLPFIADTSGEAQLELICGNNARWRAFESSINIASISCTVLDIQPIPTTTQPKPPPVTTIPTIVSFT
ncbi:unnamed protein product [Onchocerca ochengi]|uniref:C6 domain-containing protein n=1 Tax=Onchocerca ochengi TaxID=42157 RepID=A0A182EK72_ONCOC|nr:unnamed protein product [Onchocerca ochengi]